jgi:hypothetical protein
MGKRAYKAIDWDTLGYYYSKGFTNKQLAILTDRYYPGTGDATKEVRVHIAQMLKRGYYINDEGKHIAVSKRTNTDWGKYLDSKAIQR